jgi:hypothetical protein
MFLINTLTLIGPSAGTDGINPKEADKTLAAERGQPQSENCRGDRVILSNLGRLYPWLNNIRDGQFPRRPLWVKDESVGKAFLDSIEFRGKTIPRVVRGLNRTGLRMELRFDALSDGRSASVSFFRGGTLEAKIVREQVGDNDKISFNFIRQPSMNVVYTIGRTDEKTPPIKKAVPVTIQAFGRTFQGQIAPGEQQVPTVFRSFEDFVKNRTETAPIASLDDTLISRVSGVVTCDTMGCLSFIDEYFRGEITEEELEKMGCRHVASVQTSWRGVGCAIAGGILCGWKCAAMGYLLCMD